MKTKRKYALISVFDKKGVPKFAKILHQRGYTIIATEGTGKELAKYKIPFLSCQEVSKNPECFDGYMKTISFSIEAGIFFDRSNPIHVKEAEKFEIKQIDMVICNFFPFKEIVKNFNIDVKIMMRNVDFGGPTMARVAAQNFKHVLVIVDPNDYEKIAKALLENKITDKFRQQLATKAFAYICHYDFQIAKLLKSRF